MLSLSSLSSSSSKIKSGALSGTNSGAIIQGWHNIYLRTFPCSHLTFDYFTAPGELSSTAKKRMKLIKQQAADMSSISKKKSSK